MKCTICSHPQHLEILRDYAERRSLRSTAAHFGSDYRSLLRHIETCIAEVMEEFEREYFRRLLESAVDDARSVFEWLNRPRRKRSIINKKIETSWGRRNSIKNGTNEKVKNRLKTGVGGERSVTSKEFEK